MNGKDVAVGSNQQTVLYKMQKEFVLIIKLTFKYDWCNHDVHGKTTVKQTQSLNNAMLCIKL